MSREAMQQALEALEPSVSTCFDQYAHHQVMSRPEHFMNHAMYALRQALEQQAQTALRMRELHESREAAVRAEREEIARSLDKQADLAGDSMDRKWAQEMAAAVRARSNT